MTVKELKERLNNFDENLSVYHSTYDLGMFTFEEIENIAQGTNEQDWMLILE